MPIYLIFESQDDYHGGDRVIRAVDSKSLALELLDTLRAGANDLACDACGDTPSYFFQEIMLESCLT